MALGVSTSQKGPMTIHKVSVYDYFAVNLGAGEAAPHSVGDRFDFGDGRIFYFGRNSTVALAPHKMCQSAAPSANYLAAHPYAAAAIGAMSIKVTLGAAITANYAQGGYLHVDNLSLPFIAKIKSHAASATVAGTANVCEFKLFDPLPVAVTTTTTVTITRNPWDQIIVAPASGLTSIPIGVPLIAIPASNATGGTYSQGIDYYGWFQTWGPCALLGIGTNVIGQTVYWTSTSDGACASTPGGIIVPSSQYPVYGTVMRVNVTLTYSLINLTITP